jgi:hypothetical protein
VSLGRRDDGRLEGADAGKQHSGGLNTPTPKWPDYAGR